MSITPIPRSVLMSVSKPARYTGGEYNSVKKPLDREYSRFAFCFPDTYEIGMSHLGMKILYHMLNERADTYCERCFMPWVDMIEQMEIEGIPLFSLETQTPIGDFDIVGFTLQYEMCYTNVLAMLDMARIPLFSQDRRNNDPIIIAGGPCAFNIEPMAPFFDVVLIGESEEQLNQFMDLFSVYKKDKANNRAEFLKEVAMKVAGAYVPSFYDVDYNDDGMIKSIDPNLPDVPAKILKAVVGDMDKSYYPSDFIVPNTEIVHDRIFLEIFRGCSRGCRFCQAGFTTRPVREKSPETLLIQAKLAQAKTGYDEIGLLSLSTGDYSRFEEFATPLLCELEKTHSSLSLPSLRVDSFSLDIMHKAQKTRKSGLTFAPEAGTQRLRDVINKNITEEDLEKSMRLAFEGGWSGAKLYFMLGLPTETMEDVEGIALLSKKIESVFNNLPREFKRKRLELTISAAIFVPKPFTPFQWAPQDSMEVLQQKQQLLRSMLKSKAVKFLWHGSKSSLWEAVLARGDRRLSKVIYSAYKKGCRFDAWDEFFNLEKYLECMEEENLTVSFYANRQREYEEILPWDHIDVGVTKEFLISESIRATDETTTPNCTQECCACGANVFGGGVCYEQK